MPVVKDTTHGWVQNKIIAATILLLIGALAGSWLGAQTKLQIPVYDGSRTLRWITLGPTLAVNASNSTMDAVIPERVPYTGATQDLDLGTHTVNAAAFVGNGTGPSSITMKQGCPTQVPAVGTITICYDADGSLRVLLSDGTSRILLTSPLMP